MNKIVREYENLTGEKDKKVLDCLDRLTSCFRNKKFTAYIFNALKGKQFRCNIDNRINFYFNVFNKGTNKVIDASFSENNEYREAFINFSTELIDDVYKLDDPKGLVDYYMNSVQYINGYVFTNGKRYNLNGVGKNITIGYYKDGEILLGNAGRYPDSIETREFDDIFILAGNLIFDDMILENIFAYEELKNNNGKTRKNN